MGIGIALAIAGLVVAQGGFYNLPTSLFGIIVCIIAGATSLQRKHRNGSVSWVPLLFFLLACAYLVSAASNGLTLTTLSETGTWFGVAGMALLAGSQSFDQRERTIALLAWIGVASAVLGALVFLGVVPFPGGMKDNRLQFFFQYANAAGIWFAAIAALCILSLNHKLRSLAPLPLVALLLTQSGGAILVSLLAFAIGAICWCRKRQYARLMLAVSQVVLAMAVFACLCLVQGPLGLLILVVAVGLSLAFVPIEKRFASYRHQKAVALSVFGIAFAVAAATLAFFPDRIYAASTSFIERMYHIADGIAMWAGNPLLGVGPDNWQYLYPYSQTAQYHTSVVHSSYVQVALDSGFIGLALLLSAMAIGVKGLVGSGKSSSNISAVVAALMIAVHSLIDFDLQFGAIAFFLAFLLSTPRGSALPLKNLWLGLACLTLGTSVCLVGVLAETSKAGLSLANAMNNYQKAQELFEGNSFARDDVFSQTEYLVASYGLEDYERVEAFLNRFGVSSDQQAIYIAASLYESGKSERADEILIVQMETQPHNDEFFRNVRTMVDTYGLNDAFKDRYNAAVSNANGLAAAGSKWLPTQEILDTYIY